MRKIIIITALLGTAIFQPLFASDVFNKMRPDHICVAYQTTKGMFFVTDVNITGINCSVKLDESEKGIRVIIPVEKFDSGNSKRDSEVALILGGAGLTPLRYEFSYPKEVLKNSIPDTIKGIVFIQEKPHPVTLNLSQNLNAIRFQVHTKFSTLGVKVNSVGPGGIIAKPKDDLILFGQVPSKMIFKGER